jgi:hypothetical protein
MIKLLICLLSVSVNGSKYSTSNSRKLSVLFTTKSSKKCVTECIDKKKYFCPDAIKVKQHKDDSGYCCEKHNCPKSDVCSFHAPVQSKGLKYWTCPHAIDVCG